MPRSSSPSGNAGAPSSYTEAGPPERINAFGSRSRIESTDAVAGSMSANTPHSRIRLAMSCEYCPPKSRTRTSSVALLPVGGAVGGTAPEEASATAGGGGSPAATGPAGPTALGPSVIRYRNPRGNSRAPVRAHADSLLSLQLLPLAHQRRRHHHLGALEGTNVLVAASGHRRLQRPHQVEGAVVLLGRAEQDLLHRPVLPGRDAAGARQRGMERRHPPVEAAAGRLLGTGQRRAHHHRVGTGGDRPGGVGAGSDAPVGDHVDVLTGLQHVLGASRGAVGDRRRLRNAGPKHAAGRAGRARGAPDEDAR